MEDELKPDQEPEVELKEGETVGVTHSTQCKHYYAVDHEQDGNSNLLSVRCTDCWHGAMIDADIFAVQEGKIVPRTPIEKT